MIAKKPKECTRTYKWRYISVPWFNDTFILRDTSQDVPGFPSDELF